MNLQERMRDPWSLRRRLLWLVLAAIVIVTALQAASAYRSALYEADRMFDYHLAEVARSVHGGVPFAPGADDSEYSVQVWGPDGTTLYRSNGRELPAQAVLGFSDSRVQGVRLRIYTLQTPELTIQIAEARDAREARARALAANAVTPVLVLAPLLMLAIGGVIGGSLAPLARMRKQVAMRAAHDLSPLSAPGVPQEVEPLVHELNALFGRVRDTLEAQQHFVADAAHELRSPLTALRLQVQAAERARDEEARRAAVQALGAGVDRAIALVEQLLALARQEGAAGGAGEPVDLEQLARETVSELLPAEHARNIDLGLGEQRAAGDRQPTRSAAPDPAQSPRQRDQVHAGRRPGRPRDGPRRYSLLARGGRQRPGHSAGRAAARVRPLLPLAWQRGRGQRAGPGHRADRGRALGRASAAG